MTKTKRPDKYSFILYEEKEAPKFLEVRKPFVKLLLIAVPVVITAGLLAVIMSALYFKYNKESHTMQEAARVATFEQEILNYKEQVKSLNSKNQRLEKKLITKKAENISPLALFEAIPGQEDLRANKQLEIGDLRFKAQRSSVNLSFNLINNTKDGKKVTGYINIVADVDNNLFFYPKSQALTDEFQLDFSKGENFATSRFRPVKVSFPLPKDKDIFRAKVFVFSNTGDLMHAQTITHKL